MPSHWGHRELGIITGSSPIATQIPHAAGIAYAVRYRGEDAVVATWFGDGATSEGDWHEGLNFAGIHRLPVIFVCENNHYAISVPQSKQMAIGDVAERAAGYGFPGVVVDGNDVLACYEAMKQAHERARAGEGPTLIECKTYRFLGHTSDDDDKTYRSRDEVEQARHRDPLQVFGAYLRTSGLLDDVGAEELRADVKREIDEALAAAWEAPDPEPASALRHVFAEPGDPEGGGP
jgi:2-oxoisovalerate dehydrogenase E1 component alpha subunit